MRHGRRLACLGDVPRNVTVLQCGLEFFPVGIHGVTEELHRPVVFQGADGDDRRAVLIRLPHLDGRAHRRLRQEGQQHVDFAAHQVVPEKHLPSRGLIVVQRLGMIGTRIVEVGLRKMGFHQPLDPRTVLLIVEQSPRRASPA